MPFAVRPHYLILDFLFLSHEVGPFIESDDYVEERIDTLSVAADGRYNGDSQQFSQFFVIQDIPAMLQHVIHIQCDDHPDIHVNQLRGQVEVALQISRIDYVDDYVRSFLNDVFSHIEFFRTVSRQ